MKKAAAAICILFVNFTLFLKILFPVPLFVFCDANKDGVCDAQDYKVLVEAVAGTEELPEDRTPLCDINRDGVIDAFDLAEMK